MGDEVLVHELAKEFGVPVKDVLARLNGQGVIVRSGSSTISRRVARWLRDSYQRSSDGKPAGPAAADITSLVFKREAQPQRKTMQRGKARKRYIRRWDGKEVSRERIAEPEPRNRIADPEKVRKRIKELNTPERPRAKTDAEKASDDAAREKMRSQKPSTWRLGRSPGSYG
jgi:hypothetical protein